jgi:hypothetical protein
MRTREWSTVDYYAELGVAASATSEEITAAFRARARECHPDARPDDATAAERFKAMTIAYGVLTGPDRSEYDEVRSDRLRAGTRATATPPLVAGPPRRFQLTRRGAYCAFGAGVMFLVLGLSTIGALVSLHADSDRLWSEGVAARAIVVVEGGARRLEFTTASGRTVRVDAPDTKSGDLPAAGEIVELRYDRQDPTEVATRTDTTGRDITLGIVAAKFLVVGAVLTAVGTRFLFSTGPGVGPGAAI